MSKIILSIGVLLSTIAVLAPGQPITPPVPVNLTADLHNVTIDQHPLSHSPGRRRTVWNGVDGKVKAVAGGIYFMKVAVPDETGSMIRTQVRKMVLFN